MKVMVVDDEAAARSRLARLLHDLPGVTVAAEAADGLTALRLIATQRPDAVFLDVQMPSLSGFEVVSALADEGRPSIVFVTAFDQYALKAFEVSAVDYLLKPVTADRVSEAVTRLMRRGADLKLRQFSKAVDHASPLQRIVGKRRQEWHVLPIGTVEAFVADEELVFAVTSEGRFLVNRTLRDLERQLHPDDFLRVHKQALVRMVGLVVKRECAGRIVATLPSGLGVVVSRRHATALRQRLEW